MVPLPPPPDLSTRQPAKPAGAPVAAEPFADAPVWPRPGQLTAGWRWVLLLSWVAIILGLVAVGSAGEVLGKRPWWLDGPLAIVPFVLPAIAALGAILNARWAVWAGFVAVISLTVTAALDVADAPGAAAAEGVLALIGLLTTTACTAGRMPRTQRPRP